MLPTRANYTDYSCESCMAELYNYKDSVHVIMCWRKRQGGRGGEHVFDGDFSFTSNGSIRRFPTSCGALSSLSTYVSTEIFLLARGFISLCLLQQSVVHWCLFFFFFLDKSFIVSWGYMSTFFFSANSWNDSDLVHLRCRSSADVFQSTLAFWGFHSGNVFNCGFQKQQKQNTTTTTEEHNLSLNCLCVVPKLQVSN